jgi:hypothetical protein
VDPAFKYQPTQKYMFLVSSPTTMFMLFGFGYHGSKYTLPSDLLYILDNKIIYYIPFAREFFMYSGAIVQNKHATSIAVPYKFEMFEICKTHNYLLVPCLVSENDLYIGLPIENRSNLQFEYEKQLNEFIVV